MPTIRSSKRGSVLLMAVGLLTIIALLASMFLIVANLDATEATIMSSKDQANILAQSILASVVARIGDDRYCGSTTAYQYSTPYPYSAYQNKPFGQLAANISSSTWKCYVDSPSVDPWLSSCYDPTEPNGFAFLTRIAATGTESKVDTDLDGNADAYRYNTGTADTSGKSYSAAVHVSDLAGRICLNTAGLDPCATPAPTGMTTIITPTYVNLKGLLGDANYTTIHTARCNNTTQTLALYYDNCGRKVLEPASGYTPFSIADELFLLWRAPATQAPMTNQGRVYQAVPSLTASLKQRHTTFSCTGSQVRRPACALMVTSTAIPTTDPCDSLIQVFDMSTDTTTNPLRQKVYQRVLRMIHQLRIGMSASDPIADLPSFVSGNTYVTANQKKMAAHFVANLWANQRSGDAPWNFTPWKYLENGTQSGSESFTAYGLRQDLVISEAVVIHKSRSITTPPMVEPNSDHCWGYAVEILNPFASTATIPSVNYAIRFNGGSDLAPSPAIVVPAASGGTWGRKVLYNCGWGNKVGSDANVFNVTPTAIAAWVKVTSLDFSGGTSIVPRKFQLCRLKGSYHVPLDEVNTDPNELAYVTTVKNTTNWGVNLRPPDLGHPYRVSIRRDDRLTDGGNQIRALYNIAAYRRAIDYVDPNAIKPSSAWRMHLLNSSKGMADGDLADTTPPPSPPPSSPTAGGTSSYLADPTCPVSYSAYIDSRPIKSTGDVASLYFVGPILDTTATMTAFPQRIRKASSLSWGTSTGIATSMFSNIPGRGRLALAAMKINGSALDANNCHDGFTPGLYPDVPAATLWNEFVTNLRAHDTRPNEKSRIYGQININTATREVLRQLPWPKTITRNTTSYTIDKEVAISYLLAYRDMKQVSGGPNYATRSTVSVGGGTRTITGLRTDAESNIAGFLTPGEAAIPLGDYMISLMTTSTALCADYTRARNALYAAIADCITTRSDVFSVHIRVDLQGSPYIWYYTGVIDRSNCLKRENMPAVLMFTEVR